MNKKKQVEKERSRVERVVASQQGKVASVSERLKKVTDNYSLRINDPNVALAIQRDPVLSQMDGSQLSKSRKQDIRRERKHEIKLQQQARVFQNSELNDSLSAEELSDPDFNPDSFAQGRKEQKSNEQAKKDSARERARFNAAQMIGFAYHAQQGDSMREAIMNRLTSPVGQPDEEQKTLLQMLEDHQSSALSRALNSGEANLIEVTRKERYSGQVIVRGFIKALSHNADLVKDQQLLIDLLIPALNGVVNFDPSEEGGQENLQGLLDACLSYFSDNEGSQPPIGLYRLAHSLGMINKCIVATIGCERAIDRVKALLLELGISKALVKLIGSDTWNLGFSGLIDFCTGIAPGSAIQLCTILQKCTIELDPSKAAQHIATRLRRNVIIGQALQASQERIPLTPEELLQFLTIAESLPAKEVKCIIQDQQCLEWLKQIQYLKNAQESGRSLDLQNEAKWASKSQEMHIKDEFANMVAVSRAFEAENERYSHSPFQCFAAAQSYAQKQRMSVIVSPTGSGKTFIACLLAKAHQLDGQRVAIVTPNEWLAAQIEEMIGDFRHSISVFSFDQALSALNSIDVVICDESDELVLKSKVHLDIQSKTVLGFWSLFEKRTILLTATASFDLQTVLSSLYGIGPGQFVSVAPALRDNSSRTGSIHFNFEAFKDSPSFLQTLEQVITSHLSKTPIVVFYETKKVLEWVLQVVKGHQVSKFVVKNPVDLRAAKMAMRRHERGIAIVQRAFGRGADLRFREDSQVLVTFLPEDMVEAKQLAGRSSRTLNVHRCEILVESRSLSADDIQEHLEHSGKGMANEGVRAVKILLSMRQAGAHKNDGELCKVFNRSWLVSMASIYKKIGKQQALAYESSFAPMS